MAIPNLWQQIKHKEKERKAQYKDALMKIVQLKKVMEKFKTQANTLKEAFKTPKLKEICSF